MVPLAPSANGMLIPQPSGELGAAPDMSMMTSTSNPPMPGGCHVLRVRWMIWKDQGCWVQNFGFSLLGLGQLSSCYVITNLEAPSLICFKSCGGAV